MTYEFEGMGAARRRRSQRPSPRARTVAGRAGVIGSLVVKNTTNQVISIVITSGSSVASDGKIDIIGGSSKTFSLPAGMYTVHASKAWRSSPPTRVSGGQTAQVSF